MSEVSMSSETLRLSVDVDSVNKLFNDLSLSNAERKKSIKNALRRSILMVRKKAQQNLISNYPSAEVSGFKFINGSLQSFKPLNKEINVVVYKNASGARIDMIDKRKKGSRAFILKFLNGGTKMRATNKGSNRGSIDASYFFNDAVRFEMPNAEKELVNNIHEFIKKIAKKK